ncbi:MAG: SIMPL domain-containing protein [Chloroflexi bacterium]|nr:SIMPL domain-containing protein [Chloroflexota bacterium]
MGKRWLLVTGLVLIISIVGLTGCQPDSTVSGQVTGFNFSGQQEGIVVSGSGKVAAAPDIATLRLGIEAQEATVAEAQAQVAGAMERVMASLTGNGVAKKDIQTQFFNISKVTRFDEKGQREVVIGYRVTNIVAAKLRDISKAGGIIDAVAAAGGDLTRIDAINFSVEDPTEFHNQARELAMEDAKAKAKQLADLAGVTLGKATFISETSFTPPIPFPAGGFERAALAVATPISPGETEIVTTVQVTFSIK